MDLRNATGGFVRFRTKAAAVIFAWFSIQIARAARKIAGRMV